MRRAAEDNLTSQLAGWYAALKEPALGGMTLIEAKVNRMCDECGRETSATVRCQACGGAFVKSVIDIAVGEATAALRAKLAEAEKRGGSVVGTR